MINGATIRIIFAMGPYFSFSRDGKLPWGDKPLKEDLKHFQEYTKGSCVVMGSATWNSLPCYLKGRTNVVLTSSPSNLRELPFPPASSGAFVSPDVTMSGNLEDILEELSEDYDDIIIIGGRELIEEASKYADEVSCTFVNYDCKPTTCGKIRFDKILENFGNYIAEDKTVESTNLRITIIKRI